ncbi:unnamed protein product [Rotaria sp. Silwood1]|nr:unnamed protein product [Rotaria sp. Silwood1]CAF4779881.1 unnamed protein product [Rotaria sp. Silwood1]
MINLVSIDLSNNRIKHIAIDAFIGLSLIDLELTNRLESSYNQIEYIHSLAFNQTILNYLNSAGNLFSLFDQINSFLYKPSIILHDIQLTDNDYCLSRSIFHILIQTTLIIDSDHPCNCFLFKFKGSLDLEKLPICLSSDTIMKQLSRQYASIDLCCESFANSTTILPFTEWSSSSIDSSIITQTNIMTSLMSTKAETITNITSIIRTSSITILSSTEQTIISSIIKFNTTTSTHIAL